MTDEVQDHLLKTQIKFQKKYAELACKGENVHYSSSSILGREVEAELNFY